MPAEHYDVVGRAEGECAEIEDLVVQRTQGKAVLLDVRPAGLEPLDVRGFEGDWLVLEPQAGRARRRSSGSIVVDKQGLSSGDGEACGMDCRRGACATKGAKREDNGNPAVKNPESRMVIGLQGDLCMRSR